MRDASVAPLDQPGHGFAFADGVAQRTSDFLRLPRECRNVVAVTQYILDRAAGLHHVRRQFVHIEIALIAEDNRAVGIVYDDALRNVVDGEFELLLAASRRG